MHTTTSSSFRPVAAAAASLLALACGAASAQSAGQWLVSVGATRIAPNTSSSALTPPSPPNTTVDVGADTQPTLSVAYMLTDRWSVEVPLAAPFKHRISGSGAIAGVGTIGEVRVLPATVFGQYRFGEPGSRVRPYAMLGLTYAYFHDERGSATLNGINPINPAGGTALDVDSKFALSPGVGVTWRVGERWFVDAQYARTFLSTTTTLSSGQSIRTRLNPDMLRVGIGWIF